MIICGLTKLTLLDYPGIMAATVFVGGCNFRCPYCHNSGLLKKEAAVIPEEEVLSFLESRKGKLEGVCISGGEPTLYNDLVPFITKLREMGFRIKLDTNGQNPKLLKVLIDSRLVDYIAMDVKNFPDNYGPTVGLREMDCTAIDESIRLLISSKVNYEFRTTVCRELHNVESVRRIAVWLKGARAYYIQPYKDSPQVLRPGVLHAPDTEMLLAMKKAASQYVGKVLVRGLEQ